ncbi:hypothetical protein FI667_g13320, partial [Globisporangium splendens]
MFPSTQSATPASVVKGCSDTSGSSSPCVTKEVLEANKALAAAALDAFFNKRDASAVDKYVGDLAWNHSRVSGIPGVPVSIAVDVFHVKDGRLVEHWNVLQTEVTETASGRPMFPIVA